MKRIYITLLIISCFLKGIYAQQYQIVAEPMLDSVVIEYYFCFASAWDKTTFYTNIFQRYQDSISRMDDLEKDWNKYLKQELRLKQYTGFILGPYYDSSYANINRIKWVKEQPDTIPVREINYAIEKERHRYKNNIDHGNEHGNGNNIGHRNINNDDQVNKSDNGNK